MMEQTQDKRKKKPEDIELRSEKVRNIIGQIPPFLVRSGIGIIAMVVIFALAVCYFIPYYETVEGHITLFSIPESEVYNSPVQGTVYLFPHFEQDEISIKLGDTIGYIKQGNSFTADMSDSDKQIARIVTDSAVPLITDMSGRLLLNVRQSEKINEGEVLYAIAPDSVYSVYGQIELPYGYKEKITIGQQVKIELAGFPSNEYGVLRGVIDKIYTLAVDSDILGGQDSELIENNEMNLFLKADVNLPGGLMTSFRKELPFTPAMQGKTIIILSKQRLLMKLFRWQ